MNKTIISRRAICLILCALMVVPMLLTSCGGTVGNTADAQAITAQTLTITLIKEEGTTDEAIEAVEKAINEITEGKYNTHIDLQMFTESEYLEKVLYMSQQLHMNGAGPEGKYTSTEVILEDGKNYSKLPNGDTVEIDEANRSHTVYPTVVDTQLDIVLIDSIKTYNKLVNGNGEQSYLAALNETMGTLGVDMRKYINTTTLNYMSKLDSELYAVPNNTYYGEYSYMVVNKKYLDELDYDISMITDFAAAKDFIEDIMCKTDKDGNLVYGDVTPVQNFFGFDWLTYLDFESPLAYRPGVKYDTSAALPVNDIMFTSFYKTCMNILYQLNKSDKPYTTSETIDFDKNFAIGFMKGDHTVPKEYADINDDGTDDYYIVTIANPQVDNTLFESMYAISAFSKQPERSFEILKLLQTDEEIVNLIAYGILDTDYELVNGVVVSEEESGYKVNYKYAGNNFLCLPNDNMSEEELKYSADNWAFAKEHNNKIVISPYCGFTLEYATFTDYTYNIMLEDGCEFVELEDKTGVKVVKNGKDFVKAGKTQIYLYTDVILRMLEDEGAVYLEKLSKFDEAEISKYETFEEYLTALSNEFEASDVYSQFTGNASSKNNTYSNAYSPAAQYRAFWTRVYSA